MSTDLSERDATMGECPVRVIHGTGDVGWSRWLNPIRLLASMFQDGRMLIDNRHVVRCFVVNELKVRYQRSALGFLWTLLNPLMMLAVMSFVFSQMMRLSIQDYAIYLFAGIIPYQFFQTSMERGSRVLITRQDLIRKVDVQKLVFPLSEVIIGLVNLGFALGALVLMFALLGFVPRPLIALLPAVLIIFTVFAFGGVLIVMTLMTFFRDVEHIISVVLHALYFGTPILYTLELVGERAWVLQFNPMTHLIGLFQHTIYWGTMPAVETWVWSIVTAAITFLIGYAVYKRYEHEYVYRL